MFDTGSFHPDGHGDYTSISQPGSPSPAYIVAKAARRLIDGGVTVELPSKYTAETLDIITWTLGYYDVPKRVTALQADELRQIASVLYANHNTLLQADERTAVIRLQRI